MVAGSGITHSERLEYVRVHGANMHGIQAWVALPTGAEESDPSFHHHEGADLPEWHEQGIKGRLIAGKADGLSSSVKVHSPLFYKHLEMQPGARRRSEEHPSELQSLMRNSYAIFCFTK